MAIDPTSTRHLIYTSQEGAEQCIATIQNGNIEIHDGNLKTVMQQIGIQIPPHLQEQFHWKNRVYLDESEKKLFIEAFVSVYFQLHMDKRFYQFRSGSR